MTKIKVLADNHSVAKTFNGFHGFFFHSILKREINLKCERAALKHLEEGILILAVLNLQTTWERNLVI